jgi:hypothetical protein
MPSNVVNGRIKPATRYGFKNALNALISNAFLGGVNIEKFRDKVTAGLKMRESGILNAECGVVGIVISNAVFISDIYSKNTWVQRYWKNN